MHIKPVRYTVNVEKKLDISQKKLEIKIIKQITTVWQGYFTGGKLHFAGGKLHFADGKLYFADGNLLCGWQPYFAGGNHILRMATVPCGLQLFNCKLKLFFAFE